MLIAVLRVIYNFDLYDILSKYFSKPHYFQIDEKVSISDLEDLDPDLAKNLVWLLDNDIGDGIDLGMDFR